MQTALDGEVSEWLGRDLLRGVHAGRPGYRKATRAPMIHQDHRGSIKQRRHNLRTTDQIFAFRRRGLGVTRFLGIAVFVRGPLDALGRGQPGRIPARPTTPRMSGSTSRRSYLTLPEDQTALGVKSYGV